MKQHLYRPLSEMAHDEFRAWIRGRRTHLVAKMQREQAYLARRAARGVHTPTDEAYERDQVLEADLLALLDELEGAIPNDVPS